MRAKFFLYLVVALLGLVVAYFVFMFLRAIYTVVSDYFTGRELDRLSVEFAEKREQQQREAQARLDNGCRHDFNDDGGAFPEDVCRLCGLAKTKPEGDCDHVWRRSPGIIPKSACEKCKATYSSVPNA